MSKECSECRKPATNFHTACCMAHMEGEIIDGEYFVVCEKCGKMVGKLTPAKG